MASRRSFNSEGLQQGYASDVENASASKGSFGIFKDLPQIDWLKLKENEQGTVRFVPWEIGGDEKKPAWYLAVKVHKYTGPRDNGRDYLCLAENGQKCPLCEELPKKASNRYFFNLLVREGREWKQYIAEMNAPSFEAFCKASEKTNPDTGQKVTNYFMDPDTGCSVGYTGKQIVKQIGQQQAKWIEPAAIGFGEPSAITDEQLDAAIDFHSHLYFFSADELIQAIDGNHPQRKEAGAPAAVDVERVAPVEREVTHIHDDTPVVQEEARRPIIEEPELQRGGTPDVKKCSAGFPFGDREHHMKHPECQKCPEAEYKDCANLAVSST